MSEKRKLVIGIAAFFLVILASLLLYQYLGKNYTPESSGSKRCPFPKVNLRHRIQYIFPGSFPFRGTRSHKGPRLRSHRP